ncbi:hypothetical protein [uncultured Mediterranean phage]|nr:hypothetical protein [uncultured Mediterranean phage]|tara:strand:+ start:460 stop:1074 length:615 start_codon:yes stop_codon:yes gene_type:complete
MTISSSEVTTSATLEQFRVEFNNLVSDVKGLESGAASFSNIEIKEDGGLTFEGATNDNFETLITVTDPTADRTITFPDATGTVLMTGTTIDGANTSLAFGDSSSSADARMQFGASQDMQLYHDGSNSFIDNNVGALKIATSTSGIAVTIGHTTSETTIADNLTVTGTSNLVGTLSLNGTAITKTATQINTAASTGLAVAVAIAL